MSSVASRLSCALVALLSSFASPSPGQEKPGAAAAAAAPADNRDDPRPALGGATVSVPWGEFRALLDARGGAAAAAERPPVDYVFSPATYAVTVAAAKATVTANVTVTSLVKRWALVPLGPASAGVLKVTADGQPASVVMRDNALFVLVDAGSAKLEMTLERPVAVDNGVSRFDLPLLPSPIVTVTATLPGVGLEPQVGGSAASIVEKNGATAVTASYRGGDVAAVTWTPRAANAPELPARVFANTLTLVTVERGGVRCRAEVLYDVMQRGVESFRVALPEGVEVLNTQGAAVREANVVAEGKARFLVITLKGRSKGGQMVTIDYEKRFAAPAAPAQGGPAAPAPAAPAVAEVPPVTVPLLTHPDAAREKGSIGIEAPGGFEVSPTVTGARRVDVKELHEHLWQAARTPILFGFSYDAAGAGLTLSLTRHEDLAVLVAMSDACEVTTTYTPDGKSVTKMMYVMRNNLKQYMTLKLPDGAQVWSTFVNDRPVTPSRGRNGDVLIPLVKSDAVDPDDDEDDDGDAKSYKARRDKRRAEGLGATERAHVVRQQLKKLRAVDDGAVDLKPYDVEIVFITPAVKFEDKGTLKAALPQSDVPCGQIAWAVFLPAQYQVLDAEGNLREVAHFSLPFRHFGEAEYERLTDALHKKIDKAQAQLKAAQEAQQMQQAELARIAKVAGVLPVRIEIPITGEIHRFEKFLAVDEAPQLTLTYRKKVQ